MSTEANKRLVGRFITQVINTGNLAALSVFVADQIIDHNAAPRTRLELSRMSYMALLPSLFPGSPELHPRLRL